MKKKKILWKLLSFIVPITLCMGLTSCGGGDDPEPLKVNPMDISLLAEKGSSSTFTINTDNEWKANCLDNWLHLSSTSGNGNATITITAQSSNDSENPRKAVINIIVVIKQHLSTSLRNHFTSMLLSMRISTTWLF